MPETLIILKQKLLIRQRIASVASETEMKQLITNKWVQLACTKGV